MYFQIMNYLYRYHIFHIAFWCSCLKILIRLEYGGKKYKIRERKELNFSKKTFNIYSSVRLVWVHCLRLQNCRVIIRDHDVGGHDKTSPEAETPIEI